MIIPVQHVTLKLKGLEIVQFWGLLQRASLSQCVEEMKAEEVEE